MHKHQQTTAFRAAATAMLLCQELIFLAEQLGEISFIPAPFGWSQITLARPSRTELQVD